MDYDDFQLLFRTAKDILSRSSNITPEELAEISQFYRNDMSANEVLAVEAITKFANNLYFDFYYPHMVNNLKKMLTMTPKDILYMIQPRPKTPISIPHDYMLLVVEPNEAFDKWIDWAQNNLYSVRGAVKNVFHSAFHQRCKKLEYLIEHYKRTEKNDKEFLVFFRDFNYSVESNGLKVMKDVTARMKKHFKFYKENFYPLREAIQ